MTISGKLAAPLSWNGASLCLRCFIEEDHWVFGFGNKKAKLEKKLQKLLQESYELSHSDRKKSDMKASEADEVRKELEALEAESSSN